MDVEIDVALVRRLLEMQFPQWPKLFFAPVEIGAWDNRIFRLGEATSVGLPSARCYAAQVAKEQQWLPKRAPLVPVVVSQPLALGRPALGYPLHGFVCRWIVGETAGCNPSSISGAWVSQILHAI